MKLYKYKIIREYADGSRAKRANSVYRYKPDLEIGCLYTRLGRGFPGAQRVLGLTIREFPD